MHSADPVRPLDDTGDTAMACFERLERSALDFRDWSRVSACDFISATIVRIAIVKQGEIVEQQSRFVMCEVFCDLARKSMQRNATGRLGSQFCVLVEVMGRLGRSGGRADLLIAFCPNRGPHSQRDHMIEMYVLICRRRVYYQGTEVDIAL